MSYDDSDAAYDSWMEDLYREHKAEAISEFTTERLQSYFLLHPKVAAPSYAALQEAAQLQAAGFVSAAFLFAVIATETTVKAALLKPIVSGLVHDSSTSTLIAELALGHVGLDRFRDLLFQSLDNVAGVDLTSLRREHSEQTIWAEIGTLQKSRNSLVHRAVVPPPAETETAISVARVLLDDVFPRVIKAVGLHLHDHVRVCDDWTCEYEGKWSPALMEKIRANRSQA